MENIYNIKSECAGDSILNYDHKVLVKIANQKGLHARAAAAFVKLAERFEAEITVSKNGMEVCGKSIMGLMMLAAAKGSEIELKAKGKQSKKAIEALTELVNAKFNED
ncbi:MAG: HPr family phosphocarrier protein [Alphaproteobacteria bacterium]